MSPREKLILSGLFLSKFNEEGLSKLGFNGFSEAFNAIGYALGGKPASVKGYRDEFDPFFPNPRQGWHKRPLRQHCKEALHRYGELPMEQFAELLRTFFGSDGLPESSIDKHDFEGAGESAFARRLITGVAAEQYFRSVQPDIPELQDYKIEDTTRLGCGYDFRLRLPRKDDFLVVEVKGLSEKKGSVSLTTKEHSAAKFFANKFLLFVVKNFEQTPFHDIHRNPLESGLEFSRKERVIVQVTWLATV